MSNLSDAFDRWIRGSFMEINTELENLYFAQDRTGRTFRDAAKT